MYNDEKRVAYRLKEHDFSLWQLFISYLKIGFFGFGGGYAMLSLIQNEVVVQHQWMTAAEFADIVAVSQITPGPIAINSATYVGYSVGVQTGHTWCGILGSAIATFAVCMPSLTLMILVARFFMKLKGNRLVEGAMRGMRPVVIGMIAAAALLLIFPHGDNPDDRNFIDAWSWALFGGVFVGSWRKVNPILLIVLSAGAGILIYYVF
uniref:chromate transporter n=1 Tax=Alistipes shahii TaxID=328814 RepID=UPI004029F197